MRIINNKNSTSLNNLVKKNVALGFIDLEAYLVKLHIEIIVTGSEIILNDTAKSAFLKCSEYTRSNWRYDIMDNKVPIPRRENFSDIDEFRRRRTTARGYFKGAYTGLHFEVRPELINHKIPDIYFRQGIDRTRHLMEEYDLPFATNIVDKSKFAYYYDITIFSINMDERFELNTVKK